jgi:hypothetical protein
MRFAPIAPMLGIAVTTLAVSASPARAASFQVTGGVTSVLLDLDLLSSAAGLNLTGTDGTVDSAIDDGVGFTITPDTDFTFDTTSGFVPTGGVIKHEGTVTFNDTVTVGDFDIGFDAARQSSDASGFFVRDTFGTGAILFDLSAPGVANVNAPDLTIADTDLLVSSEFADFLGNADLTGADVGDAQVNAVIAQVEEEESTSVPEPGVLGILAVGALAIANRRRLHSAH